MGGQCLPADGSGIYHPGRRRGGPLRCAILLDCRNRAICFCVTGDSDCPRWMGRYRRACITRPWGGIRRSRHTGGGDRSIARTTAGGSDRYVDRLSDAWLQHWTADRGRNHPLCGLALYFLVERIRHDGCRAYSIAPSRDQRPSDKVNGLGGSWLSRRLYGAADHRVTSTDSCPDYPEGGNCRACASDPCVRRTVVVGDAASSTGRRLPFVFESQFRSRFRPCVSADVRHHDSAFLLQPLCTIS